MKKILLTIIFTHILALQFLSSQDITADVIHETTIDADDGSISVIMLAGYKPFAYAWSGPYGFTSNSSTIENLPPGTYCVTVTDALCGTVTMCRTILACNPLLSMTPGSNCPYNLSSITLTLGGGGPYTVEWNDGVVQEIQGPPIAFRGNLPAGQYCVTVTNGNGCTQSHCRTVPTVQPIQISGIVVDETCPSPLGSINLSVTGYVSPYQYQWSDGNTSKDRTGLVAGNYCVTVTDANQCSATKCFEVKKAYNSFWAEITGINHVIRDPTDPPNLCFDSSIDLTVQGSSGPFTYNWSDGATTQDIQNICAGYYSVTVTNAHGCTQVLSATVLECPSISGSSAPNITDAVVTPVSSSGATDGSIDITVSGGSSAKKYKWVNSATGLVIATTQDLSNLSVGTYCVTITTVGCGGSSSACYEIQGCESVDPNNLLTLTFDAIGDNTYNTPSKKGSVDLSVQGGVAPYTYHWNYWSANTQDLPSVPTGNYRVTVTDHCGRTAVGSVAVPLCRDFIFLPYDNCTSDPKLKFFPHYTIMESDNEFINQIVAGYEDSPTYCDREIHIDWPDGNQSDLTLDLDHLLPPGSGNPNGYIDYDPNGVYDVPSSLFGYICATISDNCGCVNTHCDFVGNDYEAAGWNWQPIGNVAPPLEGQTFPVITHCFECDLCTSAGQILNMNQMQVSDCYVNSQGDIDFGLLTYTNFDLNEPCTGGTIRCPLQETQYTVIDGAHGDLIIDWSATPQYNQSTGMCVYPLGCLFPSGTIQGVDGAVYVNNPVGYLVPNEGGLCEPPNIGTDCAGGTIIQDPEGVNQNCEIALLCIPSGEGEPIIIGHVPLWVPCSCNGYLGKLCLPTNEIIGSLNIEIFSSTYVYSDIYLDFVDDYLAQYGPPPGFLYPDFANCGCPSPNPIIGNGASDREISSASENKSGSEIVVFPVPATNEIFVQTRPGRISSIIISDVLGRNIVTLDANNIMQEAIEIDLTPFNLMPGVYVAEVVLKNGESNSIKFIKL